MSDSSASNDYQAIIDKDQSLLWHPYSSALEPSPVYPVGYAKGAKITLKDGRELIDGMSSWWSVIHGYNHPELNEAAKSQIDDFAHVMFGGFTHEPAVKLAEKLINFSPEGLTKVFLCDSGSVSVEVAMKMSLQYWRSQGKPQKHRLLSLRKGYHGDTFAAMSVCDPETGMHHIFADVLNKQIFSDSPTVGFDEAFTEDHIRDFKQQIETHAHELSAVILEPIVQGTGGMNFYSPQFLQAVRTLCDQHDVLLIADEIATGFARTGKMFACEHADVTPDILCLGKSLTGGYMTLAATLCTDKVAFGICSGEVPVFMHGPTFMANPLACAVALKNCEILERGEWKQQIQHINSIMKQELTPFETIDGVRDVRTLGAIGVVELEEPVTLHEVQDWFVSEGIWVRPFGRLVYIMPPFVISPEDLSVLCQKLGKVVEKICAHQTTKR
ncbi:adenosylmethionine--8-amino-7-oxononanoate transaminase [Sessilibacter corallicola]|uniref:Adenosylmethionine-8-amino-7-oxononanoate aminotransferase n=1 Tax=Sessilibacter corallicola TaxID=2904075 RepID=A0ABQ0A4A3_9GAMM